jgi:adenylate kinase
MMGAPGAGKGTQAVRLSGELGLPHVSTGDLFREHLSKGTTLGTEARGYMDAGKLVPDVLVIDMLFDRVAREDCREGYLLDGFPRTVAQAESLTERLEGPDGSSSVIVVDLEVPDEVIIGRAAGRLLCRGCEQIAHLDFSPPARSGVCDHCGGELYQRDDDQPQVVQQRLVTYHEQTAPVVGWYRDHGSVCAVDGNRAPDAVFVDCLACVQEVSQ